MPSWNLLPTISAPMPFQMALDEILFSRRCQALEFDTRHPTPVTRNSPPILRFYFSSEPWITVGYSYKTGFGCQVPDVGFQVSVTRRLPFCKRITGGGVVRHGNDLMFSLFAAKEDDESFGSIRKSYWKIHEALKAALEFLNFKPRFYRCDENLPKGSDCFQFPIATDLALDGEKIAGGAQKRSAGGMLHEESIRLMKGMDAERLMPALKRAFEKVFRVEIVEVDLDPEILAEAEKIAAAGGPYNADGNADGAGPLPGPVTMGPVTMVH